MADDRQLSANPISQPILALLYASQGRYGEAEPLYRRALAASEKVLGAAGFRVQTGYVSTPGATP
jgi:hypothetical protein